MTLWIDNIMFTSAYQRQVGPALVVDISQLRNPSIHTSAVTMSNHIHRKLHNPIGMHHISSVNTIKGKTHIRVFIAAAE